MASSCAIVDPIRHSSLKVGSSNSARAVITTLSTSSCSVGRFPRLHTVLVDQGYKGWLVEFAKRWFGIVVDIVKRSPGHREFVVQR